MSEEEPSGSNGSLHPTSPVVLALWALAGLVAGWLLRAATDRWGTPPVVSWSQPLALLLVATIVGYTAWVTWRTVHVRHERLAPHQAVNRLVLARACALAGAVVGGGYLGYALTWLGDPAELAAQRGWRSAAAAVAGLLVVVTSLLLERACRVRRSDR